MLRVAVVSYFDVPFFKSKYASLDTIQQTIRQPLIDNGLVITQSNVMSEGQLLVETRVWHSESGESMGSIFPIVVNKQSAQDYGSAVSYAKRYSLSGLLNLIIEDEDDDGNIDGVEFLVSAGRPPTADEDTSCCKK